MTTYILAGGCFWCLDAVYRQLRGVTSVVSGYTGGHIPNPTYDQVSTEVTGHAEVVKITFDQLIVPGDIILDIFFLIHDPTTLDRQGNDIGTRYRSAMYYADDQQKNLFESACERARRLWNSPIVTEIQPLETFYEAEEYHQDYFNNNPDNGYCSIVISPKIIKARSEYASWFKRNQTG